MKKLFRVTAVNRNDQSTITYDDVYDINHLWDSEHDTLRLMIWTGVDSPGKRESTSICRKTTSISYGRAYENRIDRRGRP